MDLLIDRRPRPLEPLELDLELSCRLSPPPRFELRQQLLAGPTHSAGAGFALPDDVALVLMAAQRAGAPITLVVTMMRDFGDLVAHEVERRLHAPTIETLRVEERRSG